VNRCFIALNPTAGNGQARQRAAKAARLLRDSGRQVTITSGRIDHSRAGDTVIAVGGDGTVHSALQICMRNGLHLGILPAGHGNDIARTLGIERWGVEQLVERWLRHPVNIDVAQVAHPQVWYLSVLATGFDARVNARANTLRGRSRYVRGLMAELRHFGATWYRIRTDGQVRDQSAVLVCVGNGAFYGAGMAICPDADVRDRQLDVTIVAEVSKSRFLALFPSVYRGTHIHRPEVTHVRTREITIDAEGRMGFADGEPIGPLPLTVTVQPAALPAYPAWS